jgi:heme/copper-type cytochrome/quinol oxidase subunit 2
VWVREMAATSAWQIILIVSVMFIVITIAALWFAFSAAKLRSKKELKEKRMDVIDKHFNEMIRIECPYCHTIYTAKRQDCPSCRAETKKILFPEIPI